MKTEHTREELRMKAGMVAGWSRTPEENSPEWRMRDAMITLAQALPEAYKEIDGLVDALVWLSYEQQCKCWCKKPARPSERMGVPHDNTCKRVATAFHNPTALLQGKDSK